MIVPHDYNSDLAQCSSIRPLNKPLTWPTKLFCNQYLLFQLFLCFFMCLYLILIEIRVFDFFLFDLVSMLNYNHLRCKQFSSYWPTLSACNIANSVAKQEQNFSNFIYLFFWFMTFFLFFLIYHSIVVIMTKAALI